MPASRLRRPQVPPPSTPEQAATEVDLRYVDDDEPGYTRVRWGQGFTYRDSRGRTVQDRVLRRRFDGLVIPPAWTDVWICRDERGHLQATGRDARGRKQYLYHPRFQEHRARTKFEVLLPFSRTLPVIRSRVETHLRRKTLDRDLVLALVVRLLDRTLVRVGNPEYARANDSYGLTTLTDDHLESGNGHPLALRFPGKSGKEVIVPMTSPRLARLAKSCQELPGQALFAYLDGEGVVRHVDSDDVNAYLRELGGPGVSAKIFRTWGATVQAARDLACAEPPTSGAAARRQVTATLKRVAGRLNNTLAVCRAYYVHPEVPAAYADGTLHEVFAKRAPCGAGLLASEQALADLLALRARRRRLEGTS
ncbi:MAG: DNA topoisomerase IB [Candidatus Krumholzibacteriia bacterium]